jgi:hypothetical protein
MMLQWVPHKDRLSFGGEGKWDEMTTGNESIAVYMLAAGAVLVNNESLPPVPRFAAYIPLGMGGTFARHVCLIPLQRVVLSHPVMVFVSFCLFF